MRVPVQSVSAIASSPSASTVWSQGGRPARSAANASVSTGGQVDSVTANGSSRQLPATIGTVGEAVGDSVGVGVGLTLGVSVAVGEFVTVADGALGGVEDGVGVDGHPLRAAFTAAISSSMRTSPLPSTSSAAQRAS